MALVDKDDISNDDDDEENLTVTADSANLRLAAVSLIQDRSGHQTVFGEHTLEVSQKIVTFSYYQII